LKAVAVELWVQYIMENLYKGNEFLKHCFNADDNVLNGSVVHLPQAGSKPTVVKNRNVFPAIAVRRVDSDITYALDTYTTDPTHIPNAELSEISYDKIGSVLGDHMAVLKEAIAESMLYKWRAEGAANIVRTTGDAVEAHTDAATGNRKKFDKANLKKARGILNKQLATKEGRVALLDSEHFEQLMDDVDLIKRDAGKELDMKNGVIHRLYGFNIMERPDVLIYDAQGVPVAKAVGSAGAIDDNAASLCWAPNAVEKAAGTIDFFENLQDATMYGDVYSALVKFGGRKRREDNSGVVAIVQDAA
jgi:hypothetical protein